MSRRINGVEFADVGHEDFTVEYDLFMHNTLSATGVLNCLSEKDGATQLLATLEASPLTPRLLSGLVKTQAVPWTAAVAQVTETAVLGCTKHAERLSLFEMLVAGLDRFFVTRKSILDDFPLIIMTGVTGRITERQPPEMRGLKQYGQWDEALRVLAGYNPDIVIKELRWHLRDFLLAYEHHLKQRAAEDFNRQMAIYATLAPYAKKGKLKPPKIPRVLRGRRTHGEE